jgi:transcription initiation factor TFIIIB Brf1 subunit/transcription initiation factor TFIIB
MAKLLKKQKHLFSILDFLDQVSRLETSSKQVQEAYDYLRNLTLQRDFEDKSEHVKRYLDNLTLTTVKHGALALLDSAEDKLDSEKAK